MVHTVLAQASRGMRVHPPMRGRQLIQQGGELSNAPTYVLTFMIVWRSFFARQLLLM